MTNLPDRRAEASRLYEEAVARREEGNTTGAFARYRRLLEIAVELEERAWEARLTTEVGRMYQDAFDLLEARRWYNRALLLFHELGSEPLAVGVLFRLAQVELLAGDMEAAERRYHETLARARAAGDGKTTGLAAAGLGHLLCETGREAEGVAELIHALNRLAASGASEAREVEDQVRGLRSRLGPLRYRQLIEEATPDTALRSTLLA